MSNLPSVSQLTIPTTVSSNPVTQQRVYATYDWDFQTGDFKLQDGKLVQLTGMPYLKVWMQKALLTAKDTLIYSGTEYGNGIYDLIGQDFHPDYQKSEYIRMIQECLLQNDAITSVSNFTFSQSGSRFAISFTVQSIFGTTTQQVVV